MVHRFLDGRAGASQAAERRGLRHHVPELRSPGEALGALSYIYPYAEGAAGILMVAGALNWISVPVALFIGSIGAVSVFKAVYIDRRELKCACVGGSSNVPLGFISLTENLMMIAMAVWMAAASLSFVGGHAM
ncbi:MauE/DoxX family redox-associated membrane protein [Agrobacterium vitis]|uniref:MauE/DoxX family redox-associated membrane protein n=1 Tax=Agrobacterium vitis TaxID=373 RepID=UPI002E31B51A|nr:MauE/DoxX family redox-associated membrane protein [Agrobacterium vitis]